MTRADGVILGDVVVIDTRAGRVDDEAGISRYGACDKQEQENCGEAVTVFHSLPSRRLVEPLA
jgi:hypothetical protein